MVNIRFIAKINNYNEKRNRNTKKVTKSRNVGFITHHPNTKAASMLIAWRLPCRSSP